MMGVIMWPFKKKVDTRPHWEIMADDSMNKFLKFCISCVFLWMGYHFVIAVYGRFFG